jgi:hypothetical protein
MNHYRSSRGAVGFEPVTICIIAPMGVMCTINVKFNEGWVRDTLVEKCENMSECEGDNPRTAPSRHAHMVKYKNGFIKIGWGKCTNI